ncbi:unnamed protein product [Eruca vesicaria subsp. sativa]|uniref:Uncharacterized protein n=1 Tax=Eruca vesicaria subsp. sativa TaxID=29727 RepID=A0ABC8L263_ERUVS|nr:unnamed protein product [Eruca vesicaria subsp. sativa]
MAGNYNFLSLNYTLALEPPGLCLSFIIRSMVMSDLELKPQGKLIVTVVRATNLKNKELIGLSDAIDRANLYMEAGADASFVEAPRDDDELKEIGKRTKGYILYNMLEGGRTPLHTPDELKEMGFHLIAHPLTSLYASTRALVDVLKILKEK